VPRGEPNRFNAAWHAGLRDHFAGNYRRARAELAEANRLLPELPDVRRITLENDERLKREPLLPWTQVAIGMLVVSAAGWRSCCSAGGSETASGSAPRKSCGSSRAEPPTILDVRASDAYARSPVRIPRSVHVALESLGDGGSVPADAARVVVAYCT